MPHRPYRFLYLLPVLLFATPADATIRRVPSEFPTIQAGIDAAIVGDTVLVAPGTYTGDGNRKITFDGKDLVLLSEAGAEATVIDAQGGPFPSNSYWVFELLSGETSAARIDGFTITGGRRYGSGAAGAAITCGGSSPTIANCIIRGNWAGDGNPYQPSKDAFGCGLGAIHIAGTVEPMSFINCVIEENGSECFFGAIWFWHAEVVFDRCVIVQSRDAAVYVYQDATCTLRRCTIAATTAAVPEAGYALVAGPDTDVTIEESIIWGNCASISVGSSALVRATCSILDSSTVTGNVAYLGTNFFTDPLFCDPRGCPIPPLGDLGDYRVQPGSIALPENNACGVLIGALGSCAATSVPSSPGFPEDAIWASPNPFSTSTSLSLGSALDRDGTLNVFDTAGRRVRELRVPRSAVPVVWDGSDENGERVAAGTYLLRLEGRESSAGRVTIVR